MKNSARDPENKEKQLQKAFALFLKKLQAIKIDCQKQCFGAQIPSQIQKPLVFYATATKGLYHIYVHSICDPLICFCHCRGLCKRRDGS